MAVESAIGSDRPACRSLGEDWRAGKWGLTPIAEDTAESLSGKAKRGLAYPSTVTVSGGGVDRAPLFFRVGLSNLAESL